MGVGAKSLQIVISLQTLLYCAKFSQGHVRVYKSDIYKNDHCLLWECQMVLACRLIVRDKCHPLTCNALVTVIMQLDQNKQWAYPHICLEQRSPVFIYGVFV